MKKSLNKIRASALLIAILVMGVLLTLTVGLSSLVVHEISVTSDVINKGKAYFEAEAGIENGLLNVRENLPGYEYNSANDTTFNSNNAYDYQILNRADAYPYFDEDQKYYLDSSGVSLDKSNLYGQHADATYNVLPLNQTVTIPLFVQTPDGTVKDVHRFLIQYYVDFTLNQSEANKAAKSFSGQAAPLENFDIMRWKVFGQTNADGVVSGKTDSISDFFPANSSDSAEHPVCIGSDPNMLVNSGCEVPTLKYVQDYKLLNTSTVDLDANKNAEDFANNINNVWSQARECYARDVGYDTATHSAVGIAVVDSSGSVDILKNCSIGGFVQNHTKNYVTLTNVVNPDIIGITDPTTRAKKANIYYRVVAMPDEGDQDPGSQLPLPREYAEIKADGYAGRTKQSIDVQYKLNSFLPVFNFSLYNTDTSKDDASSISNNGLGTLN